MTFLSYYDVCFLSPELPLAFSDISTNLSCKFSSEVELHFYLDMSLSSSLLFLLNYGNIFQSTGYFLRDKKYILVEGLIINNG